MRLLVLAAGVLTLSVVACAGRGPAAPTTSDAGTEADASGIDGRAPWGDTATPDDGQQTPDAGDLDASFDAPPADAGPALPSYSLCGKAGGASLISALYLPDGQSFAHLGDLGSIQILRASDNAFERVLPGTGRLTSLLAMARDGKTLATADEEGTLSRWALPSFTRLPGLKTGKRPSALALSPDGSRVALGDDQGMVRVFADGPSPIAEVRGHTGAVTALTIPPGAATVISAGADGRVRSIRIADGSTADLHTHQGGANALALSPEGALVASGGADKQVLIGGLAPGASSRTLGSLAGSVTAVAFNHDGTRVFAAGVGKEIRQWDQATGASLRSLEVQNGPVSRLETHPEGLYLLSASGDGVRQHYLRVSLLPSALTWGVALSPDQSLVAGTTETGELLLWSVDGSRIVRTIPAGQGLLHDVEFSPDGNLVATGGRSGTVNVWRVADGTLLRTLSVHQGEPIGLDFSSDGSRLAAATSKGAVVVWKTADGTVERTFEGMKYCYSVRFSPNQDLVGTGCFDNKAHVFRLSDGKEIYTWTGLLSMDAFAFSPDGSLVAFGNRNGVLWVNRVSDGTNVAWIQYAEINALAFTPDGKNVVVGTFDGLLWVFRIEDQKVTASTRTEGPTTDVAVSRDGSLVVANDEKGVVLWRIGDTRKDLTFKKPAVQRTQVLLPSAAPFVFVQQRTPDVAVLSWSRETGEERPLASFPNEQLHASRLTPDGQHVVVATQSRLRLLRLADGEIRAVFEEPLPAPDTLAFSADGKHMVGGRRGSMTVRIWDVTTGKLQTKLLGDSTLGVPQHLALPSVEQVLMLDSAWNVKLFDPRTGKVLRSAGTSQGPPATDVGAVLALSPDGSRFAWANGGLTITRLSDMTTITSFPKLLPHRSLVNLPDQGAHFLPDGDHVLVWTAAGLEIVRTSDGARGTILASNGTQEWALSPDGRSLFVNRSGFYCRD